MTKNHELTYTERLTTAIRPQDDFYGYVNAKWLAQHPIPDSETRWGTFNVLRDQALHDVRTLCEELQAQTVRDGSIEQQIRDFYNSGLQFDAHKDNNRAVVDDYFQKIDDCTPETFATLLGELQRVSVGPFRLIIDADDMDSRKHIMRIVQPRLTLPDRDYYLDPSEKMQDIRDEYHRHIEAMYVHVPSIATGKDALWQIIWSFEHRLAEKSRTQSALRDVQSNYHNTSFIEVQQTYSHLDWKALASALGWTDTGNISVDQPEVLAFIDNLFDSQDLEAWKTYLKWLFLVEHGGKISEELSDLRFQFFGKILSGTNEILPLWKRVITSLDGAMGEGVGRLYAARHFPEQSKQQVLKLVEDIRDVYRQRIEALDWMSEPTKQVALKKLHNTKVLIGYPNKWRDFSGLEIKPDSYLANALRAEALSTDYWLGKLSQPTSRDDWFMYPQTVNAYNDPNRLVICFPAAILQAPFFDPNAPYAANIGAIGAIIGHEFTHGFDDQGCEFDEMGNVREWQTKTERQAFAERAKLIIEQADAFETIPGVNLKGDLVIGESIADLGGLELAHQALTVHTPDTSAEIAEGLNAERLFFISFAATECGHTRDERKRQVALSDPHPIEEFRVNGILAHCDSFYAAFDVRSGDKLYRPQDQRARIW